MEDCKMFEDAKKYIGRVLNEQGVEFYKDMVDEYGFIPEQCSETSGIIIYFDKDNYCITDIVARKYSGGKKSIVDKLPKTGMRHMEVFIRYITDEPSENI